MRTILFLCSGNYYRSRFAEHYFNDRARKIGLDWLAVSRGLATECGVNNVGPISPLALEAMTRHGVPAPKSIRYPRAVDNDDLLAADLIVAVKEKEHRPLMEKHFPSWAAHIRYWNIHDLDAATSDEALPLLALEIDHSISDLVALTRIASIQSDGPTAARASADTGWQFPDVDGGKIERLQPLIVC